MMNQDGDTPRIEEYVEASPFVQGGLLPPVPSSPVGSMASLASTLPVGVNVPNVEQMLANLQMQVAEQQQLIRMLLQQQSSQMQMPPPGFQQQLNVAPQQPFPLAPITPPRRQEPMQPQQVASWSLPSPYQQSSMPYQQSSMPYQQPSMMIPPMPFQQLMAPASTAPQLQQQAPALPLPHRASLSLPDLGGSSVGDKDQQ